MRPPDQIPNLTQEEPRVGAVVYFWNGRFYSQWKIKSLHQFEGAIIIENGVGPMIVKRAECISLAIYSTEKYLDDEAAARIRYQHIIHHWSRGLRKSDEIGSLIGESARATGQMIAAAKRWKLISNDPEPSDANSAASG